MPTFSKAIGAVYRPEFTSGNAPVTSQSEGNILEWDVLKQRIYNKENLIVSSISSKLGTKISSA